MPNPLKKARIINMKTVTINNKEYKDEPLVYIDGIEYSRYRSKGRTLWFGGRLPDCRVYFDYGGYAAVDGNTFINRKWIVYELYKPF